MRKVKTEKPRKIRETRERWNLRVGGGMCRWSPSSSEGHIPRNTLLRPIAPSGAGLGRKLNLYGNKHILLISKKWTKTANKQMNSLANVFGGCFPRFLSFYGKGNLRKPAEEACGLPGFIQLASFPASPPCGLKRVLLHFLNSPKANDVFQRPHPQYSSKNL